MPYECYTNGTNGTGHLPKNARVVDLRSDTISKPTDEMRKAMFTAEVGDSIYGEDPTVRELEERSAQLFGKEEGFFVPSGTMANLIAIMIHSPLRGSEVIVGDNSHTFRFEQGGAAQFAGVQFSLVKNKDDGTFCLKELEEKIRVNPDFHEPTTSLIVVENTHNMCGGKVMPLSWLDELAKIAKKYSLALHMDGARIMNAAVYQKVPLKRIVRDFDSACFCLSKSLGCPIGSVLVGSHSFITQARRACKALGGFMRQTGIVAAAGLVALDKMIDRLEDDHKRLRRIAKAIEGMNSKIFKVDASSLQTNILMISVDKSKVLAGQVLNRLQTVLETDKVKVSLRVSSRDSGTIRIVTYWEITDQDIDDAIEKIRLVFNEFEG